LVAGFSHFIIMTDYNHLKQFLRQHRSFTWISFFLALVVPWNHLGPTGPNLLPGPTKQQTKLLNPILNCHLLAGTWPAFELLLDSWTAHSSVTLLVTVLPNWTELNWTELMSVLLALGSGLRCPHVYHRLPIVILAEVWLLIHYCSNQLCIHYCRNAFFLVPYEWLFYNSGIQPNTSQYFMNYLYREFDYEPAINRGSVRVNITHASHVRWVCSYSGPCCRQHTAMFWKKTYPKLQLIVRMLTVVMQTLQLCKDFIPVLELFLWNSKLPFG
jgi:hypothetical protein